MVYAEYIVGDYDCRRNLLCGISWHNGADNRKFYFIFNRGGELKSGLMKKIAKTMYPFIHWLFPDIPPRHKANEYIAANMAANILGLGWAATPAGLKAMRELQKLEEGGGRASDMMCAFLVLNISSLQLVPINMIAYRSQYGSVNPAAVVLPAICATMISTMAGIVFIKIMEITRYNGKKCNRKNKKKRRWIQ